jgi:hypothetical protein
MTIIPGVALIALFINNLLLRIIGGALLLLGFPFFLAFNGLRRLVRGPTPSEDETP